MKTYKNELVSEKKVLEIICNCCGKEITKDKFGYTSDYLSIEKRWGYNSSYDNEIHRFDICEECYKKFTAAFKIPLTRD